jgi:capsular exopolysaccharide synthesis family protein
MSLIFDALQRSEGERSGVDLAEMPTITDLLQRVERQAVSEWETTARHEPPDVRESTERDISSPLQTVPAITTAAESPVAANSSLNDDRSDIFAQFQSIQVSVLSQDQLVCLTDSESLAAEKFRFLGVRLRHLRRERPLKKVLITSTIPREGKSTVAANLACTLARKKQQRTLLLEGDVRRPSLSNLFGLKRLPGICEWLQGEHNLITNIYHLEGPNLWILPAGSASGNPLELLQSGRLSALMDQLATLFDWVIIDSPPVLPLADTSVWSRLADGILLVARQGTTEKRQLQRGLEALDPKKLIGALLNSSQSSALSDHYYYNRPSTAATLGTYNQTEK